MTAPVTDELLGNFLRQRAELQKWFQLRWRSAGVARYVPLERAFEYENSGPFRLTDGTRHRLLGTLDASEPRWTSIPDRIVLNDVEDFLKTTKINLDHCQDVTKLKQRLRSEGLDAGTMVESLIRFCRTTPRFPTLAARKRFPAGTPLNLIVDMDRDRIISRLLDIRCDNELADIAFHVYRDLNRIDAVPFMLAAAERNPVSVRGVARMFGKRAMERRPKELLQYLHDMPATSIYSGRGRLAQPDEVWNFGHADGAEKAILLANIARGEDPKVELKLELSPNQAVLRTPWGDHRFPSRKGLGEQTWVVPVTGERSAGE